MAQQSTGSQDMSFQSAMTDALGKAKSRTGKAINVLLDELAYAIGLSYSTVSNWRYRKKRPDDPEQAIAAAQWFIENKGLTDQEEFEQFLYSAGHPNPTTVWSKLFPRIDKPPTDNSDIFIGREEQVEKLMRAVKPGRTVVLWGTRGIGKTSLVGKVIERLAPNNKAPQQVS